MHLQVRKHGRLSGALMTAHVPGWRAPTPVRLEPGAVIRPAEVAERKRTEQELIKARQQVPAANGARVCPSVSTKRGLRTGAPAAMPSISSPH
jgi:hypothetical protein